MHRTRYLLLFTLLWTTVLAAGEDEQAVLVGLLNGFLAGASVNDAAAHQRFWAEELIYTSSSGTRFGKTDILEGMSEAGPEDATAPEVVYSAADIQVQLHGEVAVVAFRLLGKPSDPAATLMQFFNTGTFVKRNGEWRAVAWQATRIPHGDQES